MVGQQALLEAGRLGHQLHQGQVAAAVGTLQAEAMGGFPPTLFLLRKALTQFLAPQSTPGSQVNFEQVVIELGRQALPLGLQQIGGGVPGASQRRAVQAVQGELGQGRANTAGLVHALGGERGEIIPPLDAVFQVVATQSVADQDNPEGHGPGASGQQSYGRGESGPMHGRGGPSLEPN